MNKQLRGHGWREENLGEKITDRLGKDIDDTIELANFVNREAGFTICKKSHFKDFSLYPSNTNVARRNARELDTPKCPIGERVGTFHVHTEQGFPYLSRNDEQVAGKHNEIACVANLEGELNCKDYGKW